jgi:hypothetical protein
MKHAFNITCPDSNWKRLRENFFSSIFEHEMIRREGQIAIYRRFNSVSQYYDACLIEIFSRIEGTKSKIAFHERYPRPGLRFSYFNLQSAENKYERLKKYLSLENPTQKEVFELFILK